MADNARITQSQIEVIVTSNDDPQLRSTQSQLEVITTDNTDPQIRSTQSQLEVIEKLPIAGAAALSGAATLAAVGGYGVDGAIEIPAGATALAGLPNGYITTDSFTEAGDTDLTSHTDNESNAWSVTDYDTLRVSGDNDETEVK